MQTQMKYLHKYLSPKSLEEISKKLDHGKVKFLNI